MAYYAICVSKKPLGTCFFYKTACGFFEKVESFFTYLTKCLTLLSKGISPLNALSKVS